MVALTKAQMKKLLPLFTGRTALELQFALEFQYAFHEKNPFGSMPGVPVRADNAESPNMILIGSAGFVHLWGNAQNYEGTSDLLGVIDSLRANSDQNIILNLYSPKLETMFDGHSKELWTRYNYRLNRVSFHQHRGWRNQVPDGCTMQYFDVSSDEFLDKHKKDRGFWSPESKRFGFVMLKGDEIVSECSSVYYEKDTYDADTATVVEIGIETKEPYRRQGFAYVTSSAFIEHCLVHNLEPNWGCWHFKPESSALALKLGFEEISQRRVVVFEPKEGDADHESQ